MMKTSQLLKVSATLSVILLSQICLANAQKLSVDVFSAKAADVNSFVFLDSVGSLIVDATRSSKDAVEVANLVRSHGSVPKTLFITHGHPDHYLGMGALKKEFPEIRIYVANQQVKDDIIRFADLAAQNNWLSDEPQMRPKSEKNPAGFDYANELQVLTGAVLELPGGAKLEVISNFPPTEAEHETMLFSKDLNSLFASDLVYNGVHLWFGGGVDAKAIENWQFELKALKKQYAPRRVKVYPGHGDLTDVSSFDADLNYIKAFLEVIKTSKTQEEAKAMMMKNYPAWKNADFILAQSIKTQFKNLKDKK